MVYPASVAVREAGERGWLGGLHVGRWVAIPA
jgi:hypothetical protein